jgi:hypothetical protein
MFPYPPHPGPDMSRWPDGPWKQEPAAESWIDSRTKLNCAIIRHDHFGTLCGYVAVEPGHPLHGKHYAEYIKPPKGWGDNTVIGRDFGVLDIFVAAMDDERPEDQYPVSMVLPAHGGIGYSAEDTEGFWWFGFDCAHAGDLAPGMQQNLMMNAALRALLRREETYRDFDYVRGIVTRLAWALHALRALAPSAADQQPHDPSEKDQDEDGE